MSKPSDLQTLPFASQKAWANWLETWHDKSAGVWLKLSKKDSGIPSDRQRTNEIFWSQSH